MTADSIVSSGGSEPADVTCDVLVIGSGGAALTTAITARKAGLDVIIVEKQDVFGGTTATSGGMIWIPGNHHSFDLEKKTGVTDSKESARRYIIDEAGNYADFDRIEAYLDYGPEMVAFLERESEVLFEPLEYPDYHITKQDSSTVRSLIAAEYDAGKLGPHFHKLKPQLPQLLFLGFAIGSSVEMQQFFRAGRSPKAFLAVAGKMALHLIQSTIYGGPRRTVRGRALIARLGKTVFDLGIPLWLSSPARELLRDGDGVYGAVIDTPSGPKRVSARRGVVLGSGGFPHDHKRREQAYPKNAEDGVNRSVANPGNTGDGARMAEQVGGVFSAEVSNAGAWMPTSVRPDVEGPAAVWPHLVDRLKPGFISVTPEGKRFTDESCPYSDFVPAILDAQGNQNGIAYTWVIGDKRAVDRWGIGVARPSPLPRRQHVKSGYLVVGQTLTELAGKIGVPAPTLEETVSRFNADARLGKDEEFGRGSNVYDIYQGDPDHGPNPCVAPLEKAPFYAVKVFGGEIGTFAGLRTDRYARVLDDRNAPIHGLYAVGNDQLNVFGGGYPGAGATIGPGMVFGYIAGRHLGGVFDAKSDSEKAA